MGKLFKILPFNNCVFKNTFPGKLKQEDLGLTSSKLTTKGDKAHVFNVVKTGCHYSDHLPIDAVL